MNPSMTWLYAGLIISIGIWAVLAVYVFSEIKKIYARGAPYTTRLLTVWFVMWAFHHVPVIVASWYGVWPLPIDKTWALAGGLIILIAGTVIITSGMGTFGPSDRSLGTDTSTLITTGIYHWSRNPQFIGWASILLGISIMGRSGFAVALTILFVIILHWYTVRLAEPYLERLHGEAYRSYKSRTARWIGMPGKTLPLDNSHNPNKEAQHQ